MYNVRRLFSLWLLLSFFFVNHFLFSAYCFSYISSAAEFTLCTKYKCVWTRGWTEKIKVLCFCLFTASFSLCFFHMVWDAHELSDVWREYKTHLKNDHVYSGSWTMSYCHFCFFFIHWVVEYWDVLWLEITPELRTRQIAFQAWPETSLTTNVTKIYCSYIFPNRNSRHFGR